MNNLHAGGIQQSSLAVEFRAPDGQLTVEIPEGRSNIQVYTCRPGILAHRPQRFGRTRVQNTLAFSHITHMRGDPPGNL